MPLYRPTYSLHSSTDRWENWLCPTSIRSINYDDDDDDNDDDGDDGDEDDDGDDDDMGGDDDDRCWW